MMLRAAVVAALLAVSSTERLGDLQSGFVFPSDENKFKSVFQSITHGGSHIKFRKLKKDVRYFRKSSAFYKVLWQGISKGKGREFEPETQLDVGGFTELCANAFAVLALANLASGKLSDGDMNNRFQLDRLAMDKVDEEMRIVFLARAGLFTPRLSGLLHLLPDLENDFPRSIPLLQTELRKVDEETLFYIALREFCPGAKAKVCMMTGASNAAVKAKTQRVAEGLHDTLKGDNEVAIIVKLSQDDLRFPGVGKVFVDSYPNDGGSCKFALLPTGSALIQDLHAGGWNVLEISHEPSGGANLEFSSSFASLCDAYIGVQSWPADVANAALKRGAFVVPIAVGGILPNAGHVAPAGTAAREQVEAAATQAAIHVIKGVVDKVKSTPRSGTYAFLASWDLSVQGGRFPIKHSQVLLCDVESMLPDAVQHLVKADSNRTEKGYALIPEDDWVKLRSNCYSLSFGGGEEQQRCSGVYAFETDPFGVSSDQENFAHNKDIYLYGWSPVANSIPYHRVCAHKLQSEENKCETKWASEDYVIFDHKSMVWDFKDFNFNVFNFDNLLNNFNGSATNNCNSFSKSILSCELGFSEELPFSTPSGKPQCCSR